MAIQGQDWSSWQPEKPSTKGIDFVFIKATEGTHYVNPKQKAQAAHARKAGLVVGFYHFVRPGSMKAQAKFFVEECDSVEGDPLVLDWEDTGVSNAQKNEFLAEVKRLRGATHKVGLYCNTNFWLTRDKGSVCGDFLWVAHYGVSQGKPGIRDPWMIHQYTDKPIDKNYGKWSSRADMRAWAEGKSAGSKPDPKPSTGGSKPSGSSQAGKVIAVAKGEIGTKETRSGGRWVNDSKYNKWFGKIPGYGRGGYDWPWCAAFVAWVADKAGVKSLYPKTAGCAVAVSWFRKQGRFSYYPAVGAQVFFGSGGGTHTGIVTAYDGTYIWTVEGNTNTSGGAEGDGVYAKKRARRDAYTYGYGLPKFAEGITTADPALKGKSGYHYAAKASAPSASVPQSLMQEVESMSAKEVFNAVANQDMVPAPKRASTYETNPTWKMKSYFPELWDQGSRNAEAIAKVEAKVDALAEVVKALDLEGFTAALESLKLRIDVE